MSNFVKIKKIILPQNQIENVYQHLRHVGVKGFEGVALFAGIYNSETEFEIKIAIIPEQEAINIEGGLLYAVGEDELFRINKWLYENKMTLAAQIHSHPGEAYHSEMDDLFPIITKEGGFSIVVPHFAFKPFKLKDWAVYRLFPNQNWMELNPNEVNSLIAII